MEDNKNISPKKRRRGKKNLNKITFDVEAFSKSEADDLLKNLAQQSLDDKSSKQKKKPKRLKKNKRVQETAEKSISENLSNEPKTEQNEEEKVNESEESATVNSDVESEGKRKRTEPEDEAEEEGVTENKPVKRVKSAGETKESKRSIKRKKFEQLVMNKKKQSADNSEKSCLEYLSNYKYNRANWKFVKLRQIWLMDNLFDKDKIDDNLWDTVVDYFENARGAAKKILIDRALKIIEEGDSEEKEEKEGEENDETVEKVCPVKLDRARKIIQSLQE